MRTPYYRGDRFTLNCPVCGLELPERGNARRYVAWRRGFRLVHAGECAAAIDAQGVLELDPQPAPVSALRIVRLRRLSQLVVRQGQRREVPGQLFVDAGRLARRLASLDKPKRCGGPGYGSRELAHLLVDVHRPEVSAPARTAAA